MSKIKFYFNTKSLTYEKVQVKFLDRVKRVLGFLVTGIVFAAITMFFAYSYFDSPKEKKLKREIEVMEYQYDLLQERINQLEVVMNNLQERDDNIYRVIFEADPIPGTIRNAGFGGIDRYKKLEGLSNSELLVSTTQKLDQLAKKMYIQSKSFDELVNWPTEKRLCWPVFLLFNQFRIKICATWPPDMVTGRIQSTKPHTFIPAWISLPLLVLPFMQRETERLNVRIIQPRVMETTWSSTMDLVTKPFMGT
jgi:hypothetical protein